ncbi:MAG: hypothetical protein O3A46_07470 [Candidatus Poribacteria bacterium]|nr:hypothetical protein [Candidatus Poribacteria bacterium]
MRSSNVWTWSVLFALVGIVASFAQTPSTTVTGTSNVLNPAISVNGLFLGKVALSEEEHEDDHDQEGEEHEEHEEGHEDDAEHEHSHGGSGEPGIEVQEIELQLSAAIDPYLTGTIILAMHGVSGIELEEGYAETLGLPANLALRFGKFFQPFGKHNRLHTHAFPFIQSPMIHETIFGGEGLNEVGVEASVLLPTPWFSEVRASVGNGDNEVLFASESGGDLSYTGRLMNFFELTDDAKVEIGVSGATGAAADTERWSKAFGVDATFKWVAAGASKRTLIAQGEFLRGEVGDEAASGGSGVVQFRFLRRWWAQAGLDMQKPFGSDETPNRLRALIAYVPTEFSAWRIQFTQTKHPDEDPERELLLQLNVTLGSRPAHAY